MAELKLTLRDITEQKLQAWGRWAVGGVSLGYPRRSIMPEFGGGISIMPISDSEALAIDKIILGMRERERDAFDLAIAHYQKNIPIYKTRFGKNRGAVLLAIVIDRVQASLFPNDTL